jgi:hypothetical protein
MASVRRCSMVSPRPRQKHRMPYLSLCLLLLLHLLLFGFHGCKRLPLCRAFLP